jgi:beta-aspartyl-peptidase (threonine type)
MRRMSFVIVAACTVAIFLNFHAGSATGRPAESAGREIRTALEEQAAAWNRGDVEGFMQKYWKSEQLTFVGSGGVTRGWQTVLERYKRTYPGPAAMGKLTFSELEITPLAKDAALVLGRWQLERAADRPGGVFTLVLRRFPAGWRIIHDHTSSVAPPARSN